MIKANQLRIGNLIKFNNHIEKERIVTIDLRFFASWAGGRSREEMKPDEELNNYYSAITLTPEILESFGFAKQTTKTVTGFTRYCGKRMMLLVDHSENPFSNIEAYYERHFGIYECIGQRRDLKVHELQNINFALTGEELQIKL